MDSYVVGRGREMRRGNLSFVTPEIVPSCMCPLPGRRLLSPARPAADPCLSESRHQYQHFHHFPSFRGLWAHARPSHYHREGDGGLLRPRPAASMAAAALLRARADHAIASRSDRGRTLVVAPCPVGCRVPTRHHRRAHRRQSADCHPRVVGVQPDWNGHGADGDRTGHRGGRPSGHQNSVRPGRRYSLARQAAAAAKVEAAAHGAGCCRRPNPRCRLDARRTKKMEAPAADRPDHATTCSFLDWWWVCRIDRVHHDLASRVPSLCVLVCCVAEAVTDGATAPSSLI